MARILLKACIFVAKGNDMNVNEYPLKDQIEFIVASVSEFGNTYSLSLRQAFNYMDRFKGLRYLQEHYGVEHTFSFKDIVEHLTAVCRHNGGEIGQ